MTYNTKRLLRIIDNLFPGLDVIPKINRTYSGRHQKSVGAWSWYMAFNGGMVGSAYPVGDIIRNEDKTFGFCRLNDFEIALNP